MWLRQRPEEHRFRFNVRTGGVIAAGYLRYCSISMVMVRQGFKG